MGRAGVCPRARAAVPYRPSPYPPPDPLVGGGVLALASRLYPRGPIDVGRDSSVSATPKICRGARLAVDRDTGSHRGPRVPVSRTRPRPDPGDAVTTVKQESLWRWPCNGRNCTDRPPISRRTGVRRRSLSDDLRHSNPRRWRADTAILGAGRRCAWRCASSPRGSPTRSPEIRPICPARRRHRRTWHREPAARSIAEGHGRRRPGGRFALSLSHARGRGIARS